MKKNILVLVLIFISSFGVFAQKVRTTAVFDADTTTRPKAGFYGIGVRSGQAYLVPATGNNVRLANYSLFTGLTTNYLTKWNGSKMVNSGVFESGGNVGIGTASPIQKLEVAGNAILSGSSTSISFARTSGTNVGGVGWDSDIFYIGGHPSYLPAAGNIVRLFGFGDRLSLGNANSGDVLNIVQNGNVGINTTAPTSKLQVVGLPTYADNAAATSGGLTAGAFYRTSTGVLMVVY